MLDGSDLQLQTLLKHLQNPWVAFCLLVMVAALILLHGLLISRARKAEAHRQQGLRQLQEVQYQQAIIRLEEERDRLTDAIYATQTQLKSKESRVHELELALQAQQIRSEEQGNLLTAEREQIVKQREFIAREFELLANRVFESKQEQFHRSAKSNLEQVIGPFQDQLKDFYRRVDDAQQSDSVQRNQLIGQISALQEQSRQIGADAANLAQALKGNNKLVGSWGEVVLARLLEQSGLSEGREYRLQYSGTNSEGRRLQPDVVVHLPGERDIIIDSKVSLLSFERYTSNDEKEVRKAALRGHVESIRAHVRSLAGKGYDDLLGARSLDFVFMFVPVESAFLIVAQHHPEVLDEAYKKNIVITGPSSLMIALKTVEALWQRKKQEQNVAEIVSSAGRLYDQFVRFAESLQDVGTGLGRATEAYESAIRRLCEGRGNLLRRVEDLRQLGARTSKTLPAALTERAQQAAAFTPITPNPEEEDS